MPKFQEKLEGKSVLKLRAEMAAELMSFGDSEPSIMPSADAMRKAKSRIDCPETDPFAALSFLQKKYPKTIQSIGYDPFFIIFSTPFQRAVYKGEVMRNKGTTISIDATGLGRSNCGLLYQMIFPNVLADIKFDSILFQVSANR